jgi:multidrug resistance efflux pump
MMRRLSKTKVAAAALAAAVLLAAGAAVVGRRAPDARKSVTVERKPFEVWSVYDGTIESRDVRSIASQLGGPAVIVELAGDGSAVREGDVLARFDTSEWETELVRLERDGALAAHESSVLTHATIPLETEDLDIRVAQALRQYSNEVFLLEASRELRHENLISDQELARQEDKTRAAESDAAALRRKAELTRQYLHPAAIEKARLNLSALEEQLAVARRRMSNGVIRAPAAGVVSYQAIGIGGEFRAVREGDSVFRNQPFMTLPDMSNLVMRSEAPEGDLSRVRPGCKAVVSPLAYPDVSLEGKVESLGALAHSQRGRSGGKCFSMTIGIERGDERLRCGMSARARVLSYACPNALAIPRAAVWWEGDQAWCEVMKGRRTEKRALRVGMASDAEIEVLSGLEAGERVAAP